MFPRNECPHQKRVRRSNFADNPRLKSAQCPSSAASLRAWSSSWGTGARDAAWDDPHCSLLSAGVPGQRLKIKETPNWKQAVEKPWRKLVLPLWLMTFPDIYLIASAVVSTCPGVRHLPSSSLQGFQRFAEERQNVSWQSRSETQGQADCLAPSHGLNFSLKVNTQHLLNI